MKTGGTVRSSAETSIKIRLGKLEERLVCESRIRIIDGGGEAVVRPLPGDGGEGRIDGGGVRGVGREAQGPTAGGADVVDDGLVG